MKIEIAIEGPRDAIQELMLEVKRLTWTPESRLEEKEDYGDSQPDQETAAFQQCWLPKQLL